MSISSGLPPRPVVTSVHDSSCLLLHPYILQLTSIKYVQLVLESVFPLRLGPKHLQLRDLWHLDSSSHASGLRCPPSVGPS